MIGSVTITCNRFSWILLITCNSLDEDVVATASLIKQYFAKSEFASDFLMVKHLNISEVKILQ